MARIQFQLPQRFTFSTEVQVYIGHINHGHHLDNARLLGLVSEGRVRFFRALGYANELDLDGMTVAVGDVVVQYVSEAFYGETLRIELLPDDASRYGFDLVFRLSEATTAREVARGKLGMVFIDPATKRATPIPDIFRQRLQGYSLPAA